MIVENAARAATRSIANVSPSSAIPFWLIDAAFATIFVVGTLRRAVTWGQGVGTRSVPATFSGENGGGP